MEKVITKKTFKDLLDLDIPRYVAWDIETGPIADAQLPQFLDDRKIKYPKDPGQFNPTKVKYGNRTKPDSRAEWLTTCRNNHNAKVRSFEADKVKAREDALVSLKNNAALHATTNVVLAIGYGILMADGTIQIYLDEGSEAALTHRVWYMIERVKETDGSMFTYNGDGFDIPIMTQKAWKHKQNPRYLRHPKYKSMDPISVDAQKHFSMGNTQRTTSLDHATKFLGVAGKLQGVTGDMFHKLYNGGQKDRAMEYLYHDINGLFQLCKRIGLIDLPLKILQQGE